MLRGASTRLMAYEVFFMYGMVTKVVCEVIF